jgi:hypothetical protein
LEMQGCKVMSTRYCVRYELNLCPKHAKHATNDPLFLRDAEGNRLELRFDCARCEMQVYIQQLQPDR